MGKGLQLEPPKGKGLQMEPPGSSYRRIPFYGDGLQMEPFKCKKNVKIYKLSYFKL